jgi:hypothetical protein
LFDGIVHEATDSGNRKGLEDFLEEAGDNQAFGDISRNSAAFEVEELFKIDRANGRRMAALHVVGLDLEVGNRFGPRVF